MANVVGVLVVVMAVTQISVGDGMKRILALSSREASVLREERRALEASWAGLGPAVKRAPAELTRLQAHLRALYAQPGATAWRKIEAPALEARLAERTHLARRLAEAVDAQRRGLASLRLRLRDMPAHSDLENVSVRLPDPRPAPAGAKRVDIFCRHGRVMHVDLEGMEAQLIGEVRRVVGGQAGAVRLRYSDLARIVRHFRGYDFGNDSLRWRVFELGPGGLIARLDWRDPGVGEAEDQLAAEGSQYRRLLARHGPSRHYFRYHVWSDSYSVYLAARRMAEAAGFAAGWQPLDARSEFEGNLLGPPRAEHPVPVD